MDVFNQYKSFILQISFQVVKISNLWNDNFTSPLYGCGIWPFSLKDVLKLRAFETRDLRKMFDIERGNISGER